MMRKNIIFFSICILISTLSWLSIKLSQKYQKTIKLTYSFTNIPNGIDVIQSSDSIINFTFEAQGFKLVSLGKDLINASLKIDFFAYQNSTHAQNGRMSIPTRQIIEQFNANLLNHVEIIAFNPDTLKIDFTEISKKKLPIHPVFKYGESKNISVFAECIFQPDSITITGQNNKIDTLNYILTEPIDISKFLNNEMLNVKLLNPYSDKKTHFSQKNIDVRLANPDKIEFSFDLPIEKMNDKNYQYIPQQKSVNASFEIPISQINKMSIDSFKLAMQPNEASNGLIPIKTVKQLYLSKLLHLSPILINYKRVRK